MTKKFIVKDFVREVQFIFIDFKVTKKEHVTLRSMLPFFEEELREECVLRKSWR